MYRHAYNTNLTLHADYKLTPEDVKAWQHNWTASIRASKKAATFDAGAKLVINGKRLR